MPTAAVLGIPTPSTGARLTVRIPEVNGTGFESGRHGEIALTTTDGKLYVDLGAPGEEVVIKVHRRKGREGWARVEEVLDPAPSRVSPRCVHFLRCGSCQWQHLSYDEQLRLKRARLAEALTTAGLMAEAPAVVPTARPFGYRAQLRLTAFEGRLGFIGRQGEFVTVGACPVALDAVNAGLAALQDQAHGQSSLQIRGSDRSGEFVVFPVPRSVEGLQSEIVEEVGGYRLRVSPGTGLALNADQLELLAGQVQELLGGPLAGLAVDCNCGVGYLTILLTGLGSRVIAIEENKVAYDDARLNLRAVPGVEVFRGMPEEILPALDEAVSTALLAPARVGLRSDTIRALLRTRPERFVYWGQDAPSAASDLAALLAGGYRIAQLRALDLAPQTYQVSVLALLAR